MVGIDPNSSPVIDNSVVREDLFYLALREAIVIGAQREAEAGTLMRDYSVAIASGSGTLPDTVIDECLDRSTVYSTTDDTISELSSFQPRYQDYLRPVHSQIGYYTVLGPTIKFRQAGGAAGSYTGTIHLVTIGIPEIPAVLTDPITIGTDTAERCIAILANMMKGGANG